ncbi:MAG: cytochrome c oxidase accessory protein CcoG [Bacteroidetes bacterium HGW-Bacteroidetes-17]|nr:MAG: cytochrome c oxidase accessory protein CcoG [Bacteroidetes bacterium HGW-Bacteroidetes-17]
MVQFIREKPNEPSFRDHLATIDDKGKRLWVYAKSPKGKLTNYRTIVGVALLIFLFAGPFLKINGNPVLLLNFIERKIIILGMQFWPQDFHLFFLAMLSLFVFIILFTTTYGRVWCGWTCPQTIFMEFVFRKIEYLIEGNARKQKILSTQDWSYHKIWRKTTKHLIFYLISFIIGNTFLAYIIGIDSLKQIIFGNPLDHLGGLAAMIIFSGVFYFIFAHFREQVCTVVCPYGRLQGVLLDKNSIVVAYDYKRGEPKATFFKGEDRKKNNKGDCINCTQCVQVCPTGIDIRNGTQLECINCTACIDACNSMMDAVEQPRGLIRYASEKMIAHSQKWKLNARSVSYSIVLVILLALIVYLFNTRSSLETIILRAPGMLYQEQPDGRISNLYNIKMVNKTNVDMPIEIRLLSNKGEITIIGDFTKVNAQTVGESVFFINFKSKEIDNQETVIEIGIFSNGQMIEQIKTTFIGPNKYKHAKKV